MTPLPTAGGEVSCEGCGACCMHVGVPLGYGLFFRPGAASEQQWRSADGRRVLAMPAEARRELARYYAALRRGETPDRDRLEMPCLWLDVATRRCRHYDWRPQVCRDFEVGQVWCLGFRRERGIGTPGQAPQQ